VQHGDNSEAELWLELAPWVRERPQYGTEIKRSYKIIRWVTICSAYQNDGGVKMMPKNVFMALDDNETVPFTYQTGAYADTIDAKKRA
jgi:hypothetical protein